MKNNENVKKSITVNKKEYEERSRKLMKESMSQFVNLFNNSTCVVMATRNGVGILGSTEEILACLSMIVHRLNKDSHISKEDLQESFNIAFKDDEELKEHKNELDKDIHELLSEIEDLLRDIKENHED